MPAPWLPEPDLLTTAPGKLEARPQEAARGREPGVHHPEDLRYASTHEWARVESDGTVRVGISDFAQDQLGDVVYVDLPEVGRDIEREEAFGEVESTKSVSEVYAPVSGTISAVNEALGDAPEVINSDPYGEGWFVAITPAGEADLGHLLDAAAYEATTE